MFRIVSKYVFGVVFLENIFWNFFFWKNVFVELFWAENWLCLYVLKLYIASKWHSIFRHTVPLALRCPKNSVYTEWLLTHVFPFLSVSINWAPNIRHPVFQNSVQIRTGVYKSIHLRRQRRDAMWPTFSIIDLGPEKRACSSSHAGYPSRSRKNTSTNNEYQPGRPFSCAYHRNFCAVIRLWLELFSPVYALIEF